MRLALAFLFFAAPGARAASLDVTAFYRMKALSYKNLDMGLDPARNSHSYLANDARLGLAVKRIPLEQRGGDEKRHHYQQQLLPQDQSAEEFHGSRLRSPRGVEP